MAVDVARPDRYEPGVGELPSVEAYLDRLPSGLDSYPGHQVKMGVVQTWVDGHDLAGIRAALPESLQTGLLDQRVTGWVSEVHATVVYLTVRELFFDSDEAYVGAALEKNRTLLSRSIYRAASRLLTPQRLVKTGSLVFGLMHRGIETGPAPFEGKGVGWVMEFPEHLVPELIARCYATALVAAMGIGGVRHPTARIAEFGATRIEFVVEL